MDIGRNKSGCSWKKTGSQKSGRLNVSLSKKTWDKKMEERKRMKSLKIRVAELTEIKIAEKKKFNSSVVAKRERKELNEMRSSQYQVITNLEKTKRWKRSARAMLSKLPKEIFYEKFKSTGVKIN